MTVQSTAASVKTSAAKQKKIETVKNLTEKVDRAKLLVIADYRGLKHKQLEELRKTLKKNQGELVVTKNRLLIRALGDKVKGLENSLREATAVLFADAEEIAPLRELLKFFKTAGIGRTKAGLMGKQILTEEELSKLAFLPAREVLLGQLALSLRGPVYALHYALSWNLRKLAYAVKAIKDNKS